MKGDSILNEHIMGRYASYMKLLEFDDMIDVYWVRYVPSVETRAAHEINNKHVLFGKVEVFVSCEFAT